MIVVKTLFAFTYPYTAGTFPEGPLVMDPSGDIYGVTNSNGANNAGVIYELANTATGYSNLVTILASFDGVSLANPGGSPGGLIGTLPGSLIRDFSGNLVGGSRGGDYGAGAVYELKSGEISYAVAPTILASFHGTSGSAPFGLKLDAAENIFGIMNNSIFEIVWDGSNYVSTPVELATFGGVLGDNPSELVMDAAGDIFTVTETGGENRGGAVYEILKSGNGFSATPKLIASLAGFYSANIRLAIDPAGNLFGSNQNSVFEIVRANSGYLSEPKILAKANDVSSSSNAGIFGVTLDALGNVFGVSSDNYLLGPGNLFEINRNSTGYSQVRNIATLNFAQNLTQQPGASLAELVPNSAGDLFGVSVGGGPGSGGVVFEVSGVGFRTARVRADFNGDYRSDILFQKTDGSLATWAMNGDVVSGGGLFAGPGAGWAYVATADFNGDGRADLLFRSASGVLATWEMNGAQIVGGGVIGNPGGSWSLVAAADVNGDGRADILFRDAGGNFAVWEIDGTRIVGGGLIGNPGAGWTFKGAGDFNGDGKADMLFVNVSGVYATWTLNGAAVTGGATLGSPGAWSFAGLGDFNGDGTSDILFRNVAGACAIWDVAQDALAGGGLIGNPGANWTLKGNGDYRGAGTSSLLFENTGGTYATWDLANTSIVGGGVLGNPGSAYMPV